MEYPGGLKSGKVGETSPPRRLPVEVVGCDGRAFVAGGSKEGSVSVRLTPPSPMSSSEKAEQECPTTQVHQGARE